ncbi:putative uncharacterized protein [Xanthomonas citri pv. punicae str. LMG 859]|nr:putative uncharacterized protein [Xanthomonas citri pv. punicae str. LMG 859]
MSDAPRGQRRELLHQLRNRLNVMGFALYAFATRGQSRWKRCARRIRPLSNCSINSASKSAPCSSPAWNRAITVSPPAPISD